MVVYCTHSIDAGFFHQANFSLTGHMDNNRDWDSDWKVRRISRFSFIHGERSKGNIRNQKFHSGFCQKIWECLLQWQTVVFLIIKTGFRILYWLLLTLPHSPMGFRESLISPRNETSYSCCHRVEFLSFHIKLLN